MKRPTTFVGLLVVGCVTLVVVDLTLALRNRALSERILQLEHAVLAAGSAELAPGEPLPPITLLDVHGAAVDVPDPGGGPTLLLVSSDACDVCDDVAELWRSVARTTEGTRLVTLGLVLDATPQDLRERASAWPLVAPGPGAWALVRRLPGVPAALVVDGDGRLVHASFGAEQPELGEAVADYLRDAVPGGG